MNAFVCARDWPCLYCRCVCRSQWTVAGRPGLCGLTAQRLVVMEVRSEPVPASTRRLATTAPTVQGRRDKHATVPLSLVLVCVHLWLFFAISHRVVLARQTLPRARWRGDPGLLSSSTDDLCPWSPWSPCSQSCGAGSVSRRRACLCEEDGTCAAGIEAERNRREDRLCYQQPCPSK